MLGDEEDGESEVGAKEIFPPFFFCFFRFVLRGEIFCASEVRHDHRCGSCNPSASLYRHAFCRPC